MKPDELKTFQLKKGTMIRLNGLPFWLTSDTEVEGVNDPNAFTNKEEGRFTGSAES